MTHIYKTIKERSKGWEEVFQRVGFVLAEKIFRRIYRMIDKNKHKGVAMDGLIYHVLASKCLGAAIYFARAGGANSEHLGSLVKSVVDIAFEDSSKAIDKLNRTTLQ